MSPLIDIAQFRDPALLGQPIVQAVVLTAVATCPCGQTLVIRGTEDVTCACRRVWHVGALEIVSVNGQRGVKVVLAVQQP